MTATLSLGLDTFIEVYETESGKEVKHLVSATLLALYTNNFSKIPEEEPQIRQKAVDAIHSLVNNMGPVLDLN